MSVLGVAQPDARTTTARRWLMLSGNAGPSVRNRSKADMKQTFPTTASLCLNFRDGAPAHNHRANDTRLMSILPGFRYTRTAGLAAFAAFCRRHREHWEHWRGACPRDRRARMSLLASGATRFREMTPNRVTLVKLSTSLRGAQLDCFATLAMTVCIPCAV
jgi:hypothetical protein